MIKVGGPADQVMRVATDQAGGRYGTKKSAISHSLSDCAKNSPELAKKIRERVEGAEKETRRWVSYLLIAESPLMIK